MQFRCVQCSLVCCGVLCHNDNGSWSFPMGFHTFHTNVLFFLGTAVPIGSGCVYNHCFCYNIQHCLLYIQLSHGQIQPQSIYHTCKQPESLLESVPLCVPKGVHNCFASIKSSK